MDLIQEKKRTPFDLGALLKRWRNAYGGCTFRWFVGDVFFEWSLTMSDDYSRVGYISSNNPHMFMKQKHSWSGHQKNYSKNKKWIGYFSRVHPPKNGVAVKGTFVENIHEPKFRVSKKKHTPTGQGLVFCLSSKILPNQPVQVLKRPFFSFFSGYGDIYRKHMDTFVFSKNFFKGIKIFLMKITERI